MKKFAKLFTPELSFLTHAVYVVGNPNLVNKLINIGAIINEGTAIKMNTNTFIMLSQMVPLLYPATMPKVVPKSALTIKARKRNK